MTSMTRLVPHTERGPLQVLKSATPGEALHLCRCGLSANLPFCDGSHRAVRDEQPGQLYVYERRDGVLVRAAVPVPAPALLETTA
jgi:CDGSH-type Zn-finger protein